MRVLSILQVAVGLIALSSAQEVIGVPQCAQSCVKAASTGTGPCGFDYQCYCNPPYSNDGVTCVKKACDSADVQLYLDYVIGFCSVFGGFSTTGGSQATSSGSSNGGTSFVTQTTTAGNNVANTADANQGSTATAVTSAGGPQPVSAGVIAGAVVGSVVFVALVAIAVFLLIRKRKAKTAASNSSPSVTASHGATTQASASYAAPMAYAPETVESAPVSSGGKASIGQPQVHEVGIEAPEGPVRGF